MSRRILPVLALVLLALGCGGGQDSGDDSQPNKPVSGGRAGTSGDGAGAPATEVIVTSDDASLPEGCNTRQIAGLVIEFVDAFNRGDQERLSRLFFVSEGPSPSDFSEAGYSPWSWYSVSEIGEDGLIEGGFVTYDQGELLRYFAERSSRRASRADQGQLDARGPAGRGEQRGHHLRPYPRRRRPRPRARWPGAHSLRQGRHQLRESTDLHVEHGDEKGR
jgi:hypothetical protein